MTVRAPVGYVTKIGFTACIGRGVCAIHENSQSGFLYYYLQFMENNWKKIEQGSSFTAISRNDINNMQIQIPVFLEEQQKIADFLSSVDEVISLTEKKVDKLKELKKGFMQKMLV